MFQLDFIILVLDELEALQEFLLILVEVLVRGTLQQVINLVKLTEHLLWA